MALGQVIGDDVLITCLTFEQSPNFLWTYDTANSAIFGDKQMLGA